MPLALLQFCLDLWSTETAWCLWIVLLLTILLNEESGKAKNSCTCSSIWFSHICFCYIRAFKLCTLCVVRLFNDRNLFDLLIVAVSIVYASERSVFGCINLTDCFSLSEVLNSLIWYWAASGGQYSRYYLEAMASFWKPWCSNLPWNALLVRALRGIQQRLVAFQFCVHYA